MIYIFIFAIMIGLDQVTKYLAYNKLRTGGEKVVIKGFFRLTYVENTGAAFGIFSDKTSILSLFTFIVCLGLGAYLVKYYKTLNTLMRLSLTLVLAGAIGNLIDRAFRGFVVDFLSFRLFSSYNFPVFNVADICVVVGAILMFIYALFFEGEEKIDG